MALSPWQKNLAGAAALVAAATTVGGAAWAVGTATGYRFVLYKEFLVAEDQLEQTNKVLILLQFQMLDAKIKQNGHLEFNELQQYCALARELGYVQIPACGL